MPPRRRKRFPARPTVLVLRRAEPRAFMGAAYALTGIAYVRLGRSASGWSVHLQAKRAGDTANLGERFRTEYREQRSWWRAALAARAGAGRDIGHWLAAVISPSTGAPSEIAEMAAKRTEEIESLLSEGAQEDPLGIKRTWGSLRRGGR